MRGLICLLSLIYCHCMMAAESRQEIYLQRFTQYQAWHQQLPNPTTAEFLSFIQEDKPLSNKLREQWLYQLAQNKDWSTFSHYYHASSDKSLQCYAEFARYQQGLHQDVAESAKPLWLQGKSQPKACNDLFSLLLKNHDWNEKLITARLPLALEAHNVNLAIYLLKQYYPPHTEDINLLQRVVKNPTRITELSASDLHAEFYVYGLKRLISSNMNKAIELWQQAKQHQHLTEAQQQSFLRQLAIYKAMRNYQDAPLWFAKVKAAFYTPLLLDWQIRFALKYKQWHNVETLILQSPDKDTPGWQYWLARALAAQGKKDDAYAIYQRLASIRHYYGFLASIQLHQAFSFENKPVVASTALLQGYQPILQQVKTLYTSHQILPASRLLNDFSSELPKDELSALAYWLAQDLQWYGKSVYLSNNKEENNQLGLRFPLAYQNTILNHADKYKIAPELIYAIIRQESSFRDDATSSVGAAGLMQLMPATAHTVAVENKIAFTDKRQLYHADKNITLGSAYLHTLSKRYHQHALLMAAAYNAGPKQVSFWLKNHPANTIDIWIETLPWPETRGYLKNIIAFYAVYQYRLLKKPDLSSFMQPIV